MVIAGYTEALSAAICSPQAGTYFTLDQFTLAAFKTFETLSTNHLEPVRYSTILNPDEKKAVPPHALRTALDKMVELNLVTFPSASDPFLVQFACRAHYHAWLDVCEEAEVQEALTTARVNLASKYGERRRTLCTMLCWLMCLMATGRFIHDSSFVYCGCPSHTHTHIYRYSPSLAPSPSSSPPHKSVSLS
jgi:hypothetical protein